jgi:hypothetical protein
MGIELTQPLKDSIQNLLAEGNLEGNFFMTDYKTISDDTLNFSGGDNIVIEDKFNDHTLHFVFKDIDNYNILSFNVVDFSKVIRVDFSVLEEDCLISDRTIGGINIHFESGNNLFIFVCERLVKLNKSVKIKNLINQLKRNI